mmetsp:Transcript_96740/g.273308  ORF Transcript_96740/g.273308 Transcript_96740/m.273308 type:complete len:212 (-) Transcript_96740:1280-1915(-)
MARAVRLILGHPTASGSRTWKLLAASLAFPSAPRLSSGKGSSKAVDRHLLVGEVRQPLAGKNCGSSQSPLRIRPQQAIQNFHGRGGLQRKPPKPDEFRKTFVAVAPEVFEALLRALGRRPRRAPVAQDEEDNAARKHVRGADCIPPGLGHASGAGHGVLRQQHFDGASNQDAPGLGVPGHSHSDGRSFGTIALGRAVEVLANGAEKTKRSS